MMRSIVGVVALGFCASLVLAEEFNASISKVGEGKVTFAKVKFDRQNKKIEKGEEQTLPVADNVKVTQLKFNKDTKKLEAGDPLEGGLKNERFSKIGEKGLRATIVTDDDNKKITEIRVFGARKKE
jgi:hypothetical protein